MSGISSSHVAIASSLTGISGASDIFFAMKLLLNNSLRIGLSDDMTLAMFRSCIKFLLKAHCVASFPKSDRHSLNTNTEMRVENAFELPLMCALQRRKRWWARLYVYDATLYECIETLEMQGLVVEGNPVPQLYQTIRNISRNTSLIYPPREMLSLSPTELCRHVCEFIDYDLNIKHVKPGKWSFTNIANLLTCVFPC